MKQLSIILLGLAGLAISCKKKTTPSANYANAADCSTLVDTVNTYTKSTASIINLNCTSCHSSSNPSAGLNLSGYAAAKSSFLNGNSLCSIHHGSGCKAMPEGAALSSSDIQKLDCWVKNGCRQ
jgi:hypothetical protein